MCWLSFVCLDGWFWVTFYYPIIRACKTIPTDMLKVFFEKNFFQMPERPDSVTLRSMSLRDAASGQQILVLTAQ